MDLKLELLPVPVTDVDRAKAFYADKLGFVVDVDDQPMENIHQRGCTASGTIARWLHDVKLCPLTCPPGSDELLRKSESGRPE